MPVHGRERERGSSVTDAANDQHRAEGHERTSTSVSSEDTVERILSAAESLFAEKGFTNAGVREIAAQAGVTHPVIYDHIGSKQALLMAVLERSQAGRRRVAGRGLPPREAVVALARDTLEDGTSYIRILGRAFLDGMPAADWPGGFPGVEHALALLTVPVPEENESESDKEARLLLAAALAMLVGWMLIEDQLLTVVGLSHTDTEAGRETLLKSFEAVLEPALRAAEACR